ncbi:hypothetical protein [Aliikangiella coralliicola]|uniref:Uncharacterized protein n=1 Tax=Aliikangiella coralliicola TaxID=2592383 RepID=A0A545UBN6_9GAMM|nr:hypothetical protein [Aliikangiella coralliicola]TQV86884.1 hypothetical protein FLL46_13790 [Aliikangiella coralliicola]
MALEITPQDRAYIWRVVDHAVEKAGSHAKLFANRLEFFEESGRIKFHWPVWMHAIKGYLNYQYGEKKTDAMLLSILREIMAEPNYTAYLKQSQKGPVKFDKKVG